MAVDYKELLNEKVHAEYDSFVLKLRNMTGQEVLERTYEKVIKDDIATCIIQMQMNSLETKALYEKEYPLDFCYQEWLDNNYSYMNVLEDCVIEATRDAVKEFQERDESMFLSQEHVKSLKKRYPEGTRISERNKDSRDER